MVNIENKRSRKRLLLGTPALGTLLALPVTGALLASCSAHAQTVTATMVGTIQDNTGAAIPGAKVVVIEKATNLSRDTVANGSGNYSFPDLQPGTYRVVVEQTGFKREERTTVDVVVNTTTRIDFDLQTGSVTDTVTVTDAPTLLQTDRADVTTKIEADRVENLPLSVNRNFQSLLNLVPGTTPATFQHSQFFNAGSTLQTQANGLPRQSNSYQIEGIDDNERTGLLQILIPPADSIATVDVSTNNFETEQGRALGAVTNVTLKSGGNAFHGSASEYLQNNYFNARSYYSAKAGTVVYNYFGGNLSGPIIKDKLFFYGDYFRNADHETVNNTLTIPFPKYYTPNAQGNIDLSDLLKADGSGQVYDPTTGNTATGVGRVKFNGNLIPVSRVNPTVLALLRKLPAPNQNLGSLAAPSNNYFVSSPFRKDANTYDAKIDYQVSSKDHISGRYSQQIYNLYQQPSFNNFLGGPGNSGGFAGSGRQNAFSTGVNYVHTFSPTLIAEVRAGVAHYRNVANPADYLSNDATAAGVPGVNVDAFTSGQVGINIADTFSSGPFIGYAASMPWIRGEANIDFVNVWTKIAGNHTIKGGFDLRRVRDDLLQGQTYSPRGVVAYGQNQTSTPGAKVGTANDIASLLLNVPYSVGRDLATFFPAFRQWWYFSFISDKWQASPKLTIDYGLRWEIYQAPTPRKAGGFSNYDPSTNQLRIAGIGQNPLNLGFNTRYSYFSPRTGFAYRATEGTVLRGGIGLSYMQFADNTWMYNYPVRANNAYGTCASNYQAAVYTCSNGVSGPAVTIDTGFPSPVPVAIPDSGIFQITPSNALLNNQTYTYVPTNYKNPYVYSYNLTVQQAMPKGFSLQVAYVGNHGVRIATSNNINLPDRLNCGPNCAPLNIKFGHTAAVNQYFLGNSTNYNSLQLQVTRRFTNGLSWSSAYTWAKGLGYQSGDDGGLTFFQQPRRNYAPNDFDRRHNYAQSIVYELPFGVGKPFLHTGFLAHTVGGWKVSAIVQIVTGNPFTVTANGASINTSGETQTANLVKPFVKQKGIGGNGSTRTWFDTTSFAQPNGCTGYAAATPTTVTCPITPGVTVGNTGRNSFYGPGYIQDNASIFKTFAVTERIGLDVRMDVFQLSNTPQFSNPSTSLTSGTFGQVTSTIGSGQGVVNSTGGGRALQLAGIIRF
ncbi:carboxypeptidase regulatory-like domain-containing protein [Terriglobus sp.]|uniref:carboxypeptidase regulatory-like domain-containing protein n=1 Tax=Terriglobus sp. TaxID=1889013 RepID=UPI003B00A5C2